MKAKQYFTVDEDGFYGAYFPLDHSDHAFIAMLGDDIDDLLAKTGVKWLQKRGYSCLTMAPAKKDYGHHNYPLERFEKAIAFLKKQGNKKIGIIGASTTGMLALIAASYYPDITMTLAFSPSDFVMEGFYRDGKDGVQERPGDGESTVSLEGKPLPYLPFAYRHPEYWQKIQEESKGSGNFISSIHLFDESEKRHPIEEEEKIKVENIRGHIVFIGAEDDVLWDTCRYIRRMEERFSQKEHSCTYDALTYKYGTHFIFPESLLKMMLPIASRFVVGLAFRSAKEHPNECRKTRINLDRRLKEIISSW
ncbi:MAG: acyl-CoA thioester hydrolase [Erysipelotrichaceae bacterium]|nr:acyl-CoA thioester hydrolase [Erysipelotrichaceae bacterium]